MAQSDAHGLQTAHQESSFGQAPQRAVSSFEKQLLKAVSATGPKPADTETRETKQRWNQRLSDSLARAIAAELRNRGMQGVLPLDYEQGVPGNAERRLAGGIGAKKVDVSWATEESGLIFALSVKTIMWRDNQSGNFQKNLTNRRGDMLIESVTLHRRFPYAVLAAFLFLDIGAESDDVSSDGNKKKRKSTFVNSFPRLRLFTGRSDPSGREEQFEKFFILLLDSAAGQPSIRAYEADNPDREVDLNAALDEMIAIVGERNFDLYDGTDGKMTRL